MLEHWGFAQRSPPSAAKFGDLMSMAHDAIAVVALVILAAVALFSDQAGVFVAILSVATALAAWSPVGALFATCLSIPLVFHPVSAGAHEFSLLEMGIVITCVGLSLRLLAESIVDGTLNVRAPMAPAATTLIAAGLMIAGFISIAALDDAAHRREALRLLRWTIIEPIALFFAARAILRRDNSSLVGAGLILPGTALGIVAVWQILTHQTGFAVDELYRATGTYLHPNNLALYLERIFFLALVPTHVLRGWGRRIGAGASTLIGLGIVLTFSRGALLSLAAGAVVFIAIARPRRGFAAILILSSVSIVLLQLTASERLRGSESSGVIATRRSLWEAAIHIIRDNPIMGVGLDQFLYVHGSRYVLPEAWSERYASHPHNIGLDVWLSLGIPGLVLLFAGIALGVKTVYGMREGGVTRSAWQVGAISGLAAGLAHGMVDNGYFLPDIAALTWMLVALVESQSAPESIFALKPTTMKFGPHRLNG
jgi:putative inorganic carbon (HCO3(-)) transporter